MPDGQGFIDYYAILQVDCTCDAKVLEGAYRQLAKKYHPDHPETADLDRFNEVIGAYAVLRHPDKRAAYDLVYAERVQTGQDAPAASEVRQSAEPSAIDDAEAHRRILMQLYKARREHAEEPGVPVYTVQDMLGCTDETFDFHRWYLKAKGFIEVTEQGTLAITIEGVDHVIAMSRTEMQEKLRITQG